MGEKILVVDDDKVVVSLISRWLKANKYETVEAYNGMRVVALAAEEKPDLILLDNILPSSTGFSVLEKLKKSPQVSKIPVIMISAISSQQMHDLALELGAADFMGKPFDMQMMVDKIKKVLLEAKK